MLSFGETSEKYTALSHGDDQDEEDGIEETSMSTGPLPHQPQKWYSLSLRKTPFSAIAAIIIVCSITLVYFTHNLSTKPWSEYQDCGNTTETALANGCIFDIMNYAWTPRRCYDQQVVDQSLPSKPWKWYRDHNHTDEIPQDISILSQTSPVYTEHSYHMNHCLYTWRLLSRALFETDRPIVSFISAANHTDHCVELLGREKVNNATWATVHIVYTTCVMPQGSIDATEVGNAQD